MGLNQIINVQTREDATIELFVTNRPKLVHRCVGIPGIRDHDTITYVETLSKAKYQKPARRKIYIWKRADISALRTDMNEYANDFDANNSDSTDINMLWNTFIDRCKRLMKKYHLSWQVRDLTKYGLIVKWKDYQRRKAVLQQSTENRWTTRLGEIQTA